MLFPLFLEKRLTLFGVPAVIAQIFNPTAELLKTTGTTIKEANAEIETQRLTVEMKMRKCCS